MSKVLLGLSVAVSIGSVVLSPNRAAAADAWGCSYDKCIAYCTKVSGGGQCSFYCTRRLKEKRLSKVCPVS